MEGCLPWPSSRAAQRTMRVETSTENAPTSYLQLRSSRRPSQCKTMKTAAHDSDFRRAKSFRWFTKSYTQVSCRLPIHESGLSPDKSAIRKLLPARWSAALQAEQRRWQFVAGWAQRCCAPTKTKTRRTEVRPYKSEGKDGDKDNRARASLRFCGRVFMTVGRVTTFMPSAAIAVDCDLSVGSMTKVPVKSA